MVVSNKEQESTDSREIISKLRSYLQWWPLFVLFLLLTFSIAWTYLRITPPIYQSQATIMIKEDQEAPGSLSQSPLGFTTSGKVVDNEIVILTSRMVMKEVVEKLGLYAPVFSEKKFRPVPAYTLSPIKLELRQPEALTEKKKVYFDYDSDKQRVVIDMQWYPLNQWITTPMGTIRFTRNPRYQPAAGKQKLYFSLIDVKKVTNTYLNYLNVAAASKLSTIINLSLTDPVPIRAEDILNELIHVYTQAGLKDKSALAYNALAIAEERLRYVTGDLDSIEAALAEYRSKEGVTDISFQGKLYLHSVETNDQQVSDISNQLAILNQVENYVTGKSVPLRQSNIDPDAKLPASLPALEGSGESKGDAGSNGSARQYKSSSVTTDVQMAPSTVGLHDPDLSRLLNNLYDAEIHYTTLHRTTAENSPVMVSLQNEINRLKPGILENIRNQRVNLETGRQNLEATSKSYASMLNTIPEKERRLLNITRQQSIKNNVYTFLLQKREEAALALAAYVPDSRLVDSADSGSYPVSPKRSLVYVVALMLGMGVPLGIISIKGALYQRVRSKADINEVCAFPVMGEITHNSAKKPLVISEGDRSFIAEQFRQVRTALSFAAVHSSRKKLLVTSSVEGEGKTFIAANLAISLALTDKKVVLLELDLRKPQLSVFFNTSGRQGISEYLSGKASLPQILSRTIVHNNLYVIPAGTVPVDPSELILNAKLSYLISQLEKTFDYIIMDTAPAGAVTDAFEVARYCDATLYIVRYGFTSKENISRVQESIAASGLPNPSIIFNAVRTRQFNKNAYYYYDAKEASAMVRNQTGQII